MCIAPRDRLRLGTDGGVVGPGARASTGDLALPEIAYVQPGQLEALYNRAAVETSHRKAGALHALGESGAVPHLLHGCFLFSLHHFSHTFFFSVNLLLITSVLVSEVVVGMSLRQDRAVDVFFSEKPRGERVRQSAAPDNLDNLQIDGRIETHSKSSAGKHSGGFRGVRNDWSRCLWELRRVVADVTANA